MAPVFVTVAAPRTAKVAACPNKAHTGAVPPPGPTIIPPLAEPPGVVTVIVSGPFGTVPGKVKVSMVPEELTVTMDAGTVTILKPETMVIVVAPGTKPVPVIITGVRIGAGDVIPVIIGTTGVTVIMV